MNRVTYLIWVNLLFLFPSYLNAQTGPAGIGNSDGENGQPQNVMWLDASALSLTNDEALEIWNDISGNNNHAEQSAMSQRPVFKTNSINGMPAVEFDSSSNQMLPFDGNVIAGSDYTILYVAKRSSDSSFEVLLGGTETGTNNNLHLYWNYSNQIRSHHYGNDLQTDMVNTSEAWSGGTSTNTYGIFATSLNSSLSSAQRKNFQNNDFLGSRNNGGQLNAWNGAALARYRGNYGDVSIAEVIIFTSALNTAQMQIISQYLEQKYGITIKDSKYTNSDGYNNEVFGIGKEADGSHVLAGSGGLYLQENGGFDNGEYLIAGNDGSTNTGAVLTDLPSGVAERWAKDFYIQKTGNFDARIVFDIPEGFANGEYPGDIGNYELLYCPSSSGIYSIVTVGAKALAESDQVAFDVNDANLNDGYYTLGSTNAEDSPVAGQPGVTWYTLVGGDWTDPAIWTLDPSGALPNNPDNRYPQLANENVVIKDGRTVNMDLNNVTCSGLTVEGRLDVNTSTGHNFVEIRGNGRILMAADNFPEGDATHFITKGQGEGTVVYYGSSYNITNGRSFFDVELDLNTASDELTLLNDLEINGDLNIIKGVFKINDNSASSVLSVNVAGNVLVNAAGQISTGTGNTTGGYSISGSLPSSGNYHNIFHQFLVGGNFTNHGTVRFTNLSAPLYNQFAGNGGVTVRFTGASNNEVKLFGTTDFYNLVVDKGADKTYVLDLYADDAAYFRLYGPNNVGRNSNSPFSAANPEVRKALWLKKGTLKLTGNIHIPSLSEGGSGGGNGDYPIGANAGLWIAGADVTVYSTASQQADVQDFETTAQGISTNGSNQALSVYGRFRISDGFFGTRNSAGFIFWADSYAQVQIEGGTTNASQVRSTGGGGGVASYVQSGGTMIVRGNETESGEVSGSYPIFGFDDATGVFAMSGGEIIFHDQAGTNTNGLYIPSSEGNYNVTGGKITVEIDGNRTFEIGSNANLWDLEIKRLNTSGTAVVRMTDDLVVAGNLTINENTRLDVQDDSDGTDYDLSIGGNFYLQDGGSYNARANTTRFIRNGRSNVYIRNTDNEHELTFYNVELSKDQRYNSSLFHRVEFSSNGRAASLAPVLIQNNLTITRGEFDVDDYLVDVGGNIEIVDGQIIASSSNPGRIVLSGAGQTQTLKGAVNSFSSFGNLELYNEFGVQLLTSISIDDLYLTPRNGSSIFDLGVNRLEVLGSIHSSGTFSSDVMIQTAGNAGDGGLSLFLDLSSGSSGDQILLPVGTVGKYNPVTVTQVASIADQGNVIVKPVENDHPSSTKPSKTIPYYWVVDTAGFASLADNQLKYTFTFNSGSIPGGANKLLHLSTDDFLWTEHPKNITGSDINFPYDADLSGDYTVGNHSDFKDPVVYYSTTVGSGNDTNFGTGDNWNNSSRWSTVGHYSNVNAENSYPQEGDIAILGFGLDNASDITDNNQRSHWFYVNNDVNVARLIFADEVVNQDGVVVPRETSYLPQLVIDDNPNLDVNFGVISGSGTFNVQVGCSSCNSDPDISVPRVANIQGDFGEFINSEASRFDYDLYTSNNSAVYLPKSFPEIYPNVHVKGQNGNNRTLIFDEDVLIKGNLIIRQDAVLLLSDKTEGDIEVLGDLLFTVNNGSDKLEFPSSGQERTFTLHGDVVMTDGKGDRISVRNDNPSALTHRFRLGGSIFKESDNYIDFFSDNSGGNNVILEIFGESSASFQSDNNPMELYRLEMNKMEGRSFDFQDAFTLNGPTDGDSKALELISGRLQLRDPAIDITLSSGGADFRIPAEAELNTGLQSTVRVAGNNTGIWLDGRINVGWDTYWYINGGTNNYIEYTASGSSTIDVYQGHLYVGSQIRRSPTSEEGILHFNQHHDNSVIVIGTNANDGGEASRGVFELLNESTFSQVDNAEIVIANAVSNASFPSFYMDISDANIDLGSNSQFTFGNTNTQPNQSLGVYSSSPLVDVLVSNASGNNPELVMQTVPLELNNLNVDAGASLNANGLDLTINGNFTNAGDYLASGNTTYFTGLTDQTLSGNTAFWNLSKAGSTDLSLISGATDVVVENEMNFSTGSFTDNSNTVYVAGSLHFDGLHLNGGTGKGIVLNGTLNQVLTGSGTFGKLTINNVNGVHVPIGNELIITRSLRMERGVFNIDKNLLVLGENCEIEEVSGIAPFSATKMIQTNMSFTDNGLKKVFPSGAGSFVFPMGSVGKYTPVTFDITANTATGGSIVVKPANERHPSVSDPNNVLQYHWVIRAEGMTGFAGTARLKYKLSDIALDGSNMIDDYWTARLLADGSGDWNKFSGADVIDESNQELVFTFSGTNDAGISGDYTAGLDAAIPDQVPGYVTTATGLWTDENIWDTYPTSGGTVPAGGPRGAMVFVDHEVTIPANYVSSYRTTINGTGKVAVGQTFGHRLGEVSGEGVLKLESGNLPAGVYADFLQSGTFEFSGTGNYDVLSSFNAVNNLIFSGTGDRRLPNLSLQINGDVLLSGPNLINEHSKTIGLKGDFGFTSGSFEAGTGTDAQWIFNGSATQHISGPGVFEGTNGFNHAVVNNPIGVLLETNVEVQNTLTLADGVINNTLGNRFAVTNAAADAVVGGDASSYVSGPFEKTIFNGGSFSFPVGNGGRYGELLVSQVQSGAALPWVAAYFNQNPDNNGLDTESLVSPLEFVSKNEYWNVKGPDGANADVTIRWDSQSGVSSDPSERNDLRMATWSDLPTDAWSVAGSDISDNGASAGTIKTDTPLSFNEFAAGNYFTIGGTTVYTYSWIGNTADWFTASNWAANTVPSMSTEVDIPENPSGGLQPVIDGDAYCKDLLIYPNAVVTLEPGATLTVDNSLVNNGEIFLKSNPDNVSALNVPADNADSGYGRIELPVKANQWYRLGQPFMSPTGAMYDAQEATSWVYRSTTNWQRITNNANLIDPMEGIMVLYESDHTITFDGLLNSGPKSWTIPYGRGYYLFSNPYPSAIEWDIDDVEDTGVTISDNLSATIYYRVYAGSQVGDYMITYNGFSGLSTIEDGGSFPSGYTAQNIGTISPLQSVWVRVNDTPAGDATIDLTNKARVADNSMPLKSASGSQNERDILRLMQTNDFISDVSVIYFDEKFEDGFDRADSEKMFNSSKKVPEIYTWVDGKKMSINGLSQLSIEPRSIPLSVRNQVDSQVAFSVRLDEFSDEYDVFIEDKVTGSMIDMRVTSEYVYSPQKMGDVHDRFVLHISPVLEVPTHVNEQLTGNGNGKITIYGEGKYANVQISLDLLLKGFANIDLMDLNGRFISSAKTESTETKIQLPDATGIYIIKVTVGDQQKTAKVMRN